MINGILNTTWTSQINEINLNYLTGNVNIINWVVNISFLNIYSNILIVKLDFLDKNNNDNSGMEFCTFTLENNNKLKGIDSNGIYDGYYDNVNNVIHLNFRGTEHINNSNNNCMNSNNLNSRIIKHFTGVFNRIN